ncbi:lysophospholipase L2 [Oxobacter pfennigii]|uniref:Lysophospholipase L2 n=1 Tax=Oxobacter pfennigii TaxID=36849 RepID=A0A0P8W808_9CLOT|nr:alpha/beta hydrolase [Oxobacter pfennigii]KPU44811.1 lysophospholipase L2 [Oxobacter pfennigii]
MKRKEFTFISHEEVSIHTYKWIPKENVKIKGAVQISHGMAETAARYDRFASFLNNKGYIVYANDHRGHGKTAGQKENLGFAGKDSFNFMLKDMIKLTEIIRRESNDIPIYLFGHSMGSILAQRYIISNGQDINGVILSGTFGNQGIMIDIGIKIARMEMASKGERHQSIRINKMTTESYNNAFSPNRTKSDWLSRDTEEVDKYVNDPYCGYIMSSGFYYDFFRGTKAAHKKENIKNIRRDLPIYLFSGELDPVGKNCKSVLWLIREYQKLGICDVTYKFYKGGRHEMLNEINKDEVMNDVLAWLEAH